MFFDGNSCVWYSMAESVSFLPHICKFHVTRGTANGGGRSIWLLAPGTRNPVTLLSVTTVFVFPFTSSSCCTVHWALPNTCALPSFVHLPTATFYFISSKQYFHPRPISILYFIIISPTQLCILKISIWSLWVWRSQCNYYVTMSQSSFLLKCADVSEDLGAPITKAVKSSHLRWRK
jgi:hypothetical protein